MHDVVKLPPAGFLPLVAARINFEHIARLRRERQAQGKRQPAVFMFLDRAAQSGISPARKLNHTLIEPAVRLRSDCTPVPFLSYCSP